MSWFGDQLSSFTERISDLTTVLDGGGANKNAESGLLPNHLYEEHIKTIEAKEFLIKQLVGERDMLEKSIVELDEQHREAVEELLSLKSQMMKENKDLKRQLLETETRLNSLEESRNSWSEDTFDESPLHRPSFDRPCLDSLGQNLNALTILSILRNCHTDAILREEIPEMERVMGELGEEKEFTEKMASYISDLKFMCSDGQRLLPFLKETARSVDALVSALNQDKNGDAEVVADTTEIHTSAARPRLTRHRSLELLKNGSYCNNSTHHSHLSLQTCEKSSQTVHESHEQDNAPPTCNAITSTENILQHDVLIQTISSVIPTTSTDTQTDSNLKCSKCEDSRSKLDALTTENSSLKQQLDQVVGELLAFRQNIERREIALQTELPCQECEELSKKLSAVGNFDTDSRKAMPHDDNFVSWLEKQTQIVRNIEDNSTMEHSEKFDSKEEITMLKQKLDAILKCLRARDMDFAQVCNGSNCVSQLPDHLAVSDSDKLLLQQRLKTLDLEKSQLLCVLNEKSQECSSLKSEVHRLTSIVASEKQALLKLQKDNHELKLKQENNLDPELTKDTLKKLSQLIRDKDLEIEALNQKNLSLTSVVQESSNITNEADAAIEREDLMRQLKTFESDREKIMISYNSKDQECRQQASEIKKLTEVLETQTERWEALQSQHETVTQHYEDKQRSAINLQNETIVLKQHINDLEKRLVDLKDKYNEAINEMNSENTITIPRKIFEDGKEQMESLNSLMKEKNDLIHEKDCMILELSQKSKSGKLSQEQLSKDLSISKKECENLQKKLSECEAISLSSKEGNEVLIQKLGDKQSEMNLLRDMKERLSVALKEKEFVIQTLEEKIASLSQVIHENNANSKDSMDVDQILAESKEMYSKAQMFCRERDETVLSLSQSQQENQELKNEFHKLKISDEHLKSELDRLRKHLLEVEESYTYEALQAEEREKALRHQLIDLEEAAHISTSAVLDASQQANLQVASLQEQIVMIANQRDSALAQLSELEDKTQQYAASLSNLQLVIEQMQKGHKMKMTSAERKWQGEIEKTKLDYSEFKKLLDAKELQLEESSQALEAASRLSEQLDAKEEIILKLKEELASMKNTMQSTTQEISAMRSNSEGKVDRVVMKSLVLGYFSTPPGQKSEVIRLLARVLDFSQDEMAKAGIVVCRNSGNIEHRGIFSSLFSRLPSLKASPAEHQANEPKQQQPSTSNEQSLGALFVKFLEHESQPFISMPLPAEKMALELTSKSKGTKAQLPRHDFSFSPSKSPLLIGIEASFPTFAPVPTLNYTSPAPSILQEVLE